MRYITCLTSLFLLLGAAHASEGGSLRCEIDGAPLPVADVSADFNTSPSGVTGMSGHVSLFRLMSRDEGEGPSSGVELKTQDVAGIGEAPMSTRRSWRSQLRWQGRDLDVSKGRFQFSLFQPSWPRGRAAGTLEFRAEGKKGLCHFDVTMKVIDRDRIRAHIQG